MVQITFFYLNFRLRYTINFYAPTVHVNERLEDGNNLRLRIPLFWKENKRNHLYYAVCIMLTRIFLYIMRHMYLRSTRCSIRIGDMIQWHFQRFCGTCLRYHIYNIGGTWLCIISDLPVQKGEKIFSLMFVDLSSSFMLTTKSNFSFTTTVLNVVWIFGLEPVTVHLIAFAILLLIPKVNKTAWAHTQPQLIAPFQLAITSWFQ